MQLPVPAHRPGRPLLHLRGPRPGTAPVIRRLGEALGALRQRLAAHPAPSELGVYICSDPCRVSGLGHGCVLADGHLVPVTEAPAYLGCACYVVPVQDTICARCGHPYPAHFMPVVGFPKGICMGDAPDGPCDCATDLFRFPSSPRPE